MKKVIITVQYDITSALPDTHEQMSDQEIIEWIGDIPEAISEEGNFYCTEKSPYIVKKVDRI